jgi:hypothetical protein
MMYGNGLRKNIKLLQNENGMAVVWNFSLAFGVIEIINQPLKLGLWNAVW